MTDKTIQFTISDDHEKEMREILVSVYNSLVEKGYNPTSQLVGYILSRPHLHHNPQQCKKSYQKNRQR